MSLLVALETNRICLAGKRPLLIQFQTDACLTPTILATLVWLPILDTAFLIALIKPQYS